jgi:hypothetical protein
VVFWVIISRGLAGGYQCFGCTCCLYLLGRSDISSLNDEDLNKRSLRDAKSQRIHFDILVYSKLEQTFLLLL